jgi:hypothetical protein
MVDPYQAAAKAAEERAEAERATRLAAASRHREDKSEVPVGDTAAQLAALDLACLEAGLGPLAVVLSQLIRERHGIQLGTLAGPAPAP